MDADQYDPHSTFSHSVTYLHAIYPFHPGFVRETFSTCSGERRRILGFRRDLLAGLPSFPQYYRTNAVVRGNEVKIWKGGCIK